MVCSKCGRKTEKEWMFCAYCGESISRVSVKKISPEFQVSPKQGDEMIKTLNEQLKNVLSAMGMPPNMKIEVTDIKTSHTIPPAKPVQVTPKPSQVLQKQKKTDEDDGFDNGTVRKVKETLEPFTKVTKDDGETKYVIKVPDVLSAKDVNIRVYSESIEVRAYSKDRCYFKILNKDVNAQIVDKKFQDQMLKLIVR